MLTIQQLIDYAEKHVKRAPDHLKLALGYNVPIKDNPRHVLEYFYDWHKNGKHIRLFKK